MEGRRRLPPGGRVVVLWVLFTIFLVGVTIVGGAIVKTAKAPAESDFFYREHLAQLARVGLTDATNWLRRQPVQPVVEFAPTAADSKDPEVGLVREIEITDGIWGRYEVWRRNPADADHPDRKRWHAEDVSRNRGYGADQPGRVWRLRSIGYVFRRVNPHVPFDEEPNQVLGSEVHELEVTRLGLRLPGQAALCVRQGSDAMISRQAVIAGGADAVGVYYHASGGAPKVRNGDVGGAAAVVPAMGEGTYEDDARAVFGVDERTLVAMADDCLTSTAKFPVPMRPDTLFVLRGGPLQFNRAHPLRGRGVLFVDGDLHLESGNAAQFEGLLYVNGNLTVHGPAALRGAVVVTGNVLLQGGNGEAVLTYDDDVLRNLRAAVCTYRTSRPARRLGHAPARPN